MAVLVVSRAAVHVVFLFQPLLFIYSLLIICFKDNNNININLRLEALVKLATCNLLKSIRTY